jgi:hypothetical protein
MNNKKYVRTPSYPILISGHWYLMYAWQLSLFLSHTHSLSLSLTHSRALSLSIITHCHSLRARALSLALSSYTADTGT